MTTRAYVPLGRILVGRRGELIDATCFGEGSWISELRVAIDAAHPRLSEYPLFVLQRAVEEGDDGC